MSEQRAQRKVQKALGVFDKSVKEVEGANDILTQGVQQDEQTIASYKAKISEINGKIQDAKADKKSKQNEIDKNNVLLEKLKHFSK